MKFFSEKRQRLNRLYELVKNASRKSMPKCVKCGFQGAERNPLTTDHIRGREGSSDRIPLLFAPTNLQTLCMACHKLKTARKFDKPDARTSEQAADMVCLQAAIQRFLPQFSPACALKHTEGDLHVAILKGIDFWEGERVA